MQESKNQNQEVELDENHLIQIRKDKLKELQEQGKDPFEITKFNRTNSAGEIKANYEKFENKDVTVAGRIIAKRIMGKASFCTIQDSDEKIQSYVSINDLGEESYKAFKTYDIGDIIGITGFVFKTRTEEISVHAKEVTLLSKSLRPLPEKFHGLKDVDLRYRQRYVDLIMNPEVKETFRKRSQIISEIRKILDENGGKDIQIITKIENVEGISNLDNILLEADAQMIARGDMATETDFTEPPVIQKRIIKTSNKLCKPAITATQMLESMTHQPLPTRAEASDVANAVYDRTGAIMLSGECAQGDYPVECVKTMVKIANRVEPEVNYWKRFDENDDVELDTLAKNVAYATCVTAKNMKADAIVCYTHSGSTARNLAGLGAGCPILAITDNKRTFHQLGLVWNVTPVFVDAKETINKTIEAGIEKLKSKEILEKGDLVIIAGGDQIMKDTESSVNKTLGGVLRV